MLSAALSTRTSPPPMRVMGAKIPGKARGFSVIDVSAVFMSNALISRGVRVGYFWTSSAAEPETMGAEPEVPPNAVSPVPVPASADTEAPGAPMSGLMAL